MHERTPPVRSREYLEKLAQQELGPVQKAYVRAERSRMRMAHDRERHKLQEAHEARMDAIELAAHFGVTLEVVGKGSEKGLDGFTVENVLSFLKEEQLSEAQAFLKERKAQAAQTASASAPPSRGR